ncbi:MAG: hypothetical protein ACQKBU_12430 [Verrucomicrobiales bacterium]
MIAHERDSGLALHGLEMRGGSGDKVPNAAMQVACFLMHHSDSERMTRALAKAIYVHWTSDGLPNNSFEFPPSE